MIAFIDDHRQVHGVEPICRVLSEHGCRIAPSTYYEQLSRRPSRRALRDEQVVAVMLAERAGQKLVKRFGARKMWLHLRSKGHDVARCTIERLYRQQGWEGARRGAVHLRTTTADPAHERPADLVDRDFVVHAPNRLWVADFTYVATWSGTVYVAFIFDAFSRMIVGWRAATSMTTDLVLDALEMAIWNRRQDGITDLTGLVHHNDAGSQYTSFAFTQRLIDAGVDPSVGSVGDAYDNALAESTIGLFKNEAIRDDSPFRNGPLRTVDDVEWVTAEWVDWYNHRRLHSTLGDVPPDEFEAVYYADLETPSHPVLAPA